MIRDQHVTEVRFAIIGIVLFVGFALLGAYVSSRAPTRLDIAAFALRGSATAEAAFFTALGRWYVLVPIAICLATLAFALHARPIAIGALAVSQILSQGLVAAVKPIFHRARPDQWLLYRERDLSFPSGHATTAIVFFLGLAALIWRTSQVSRPIATVGVAASVICVIGIPWSRLALGAHYATDVLGGLLLGGGWLCCTIAIASRAGML